MFPRELLWVGPASFLVARGVCDLIRRIALRHALLDVPNERSLHKEPVPRLGGLAITTATWLLVGGVLAFRPALASRPVMCWLVGSLGVSALGLFDDLRPVSARVRFATQFVIAGAFCVSLEPEHALRIASTSFLDVPSWFGASLMTIWIVAVLNIYNFMDGMDGLAGMQAVGAAVAYAVAFYLTKQTDLALIALVVAAASAGFLVHNRPPAKIFMGDSGSTFLGFTFASLALAGATREVSTPFVMGPIVLAPFLFDGTFTILRRLLRGEPIWRAHRSHLYQRAVGAGRTHAQVLGPYAAWIAVAGVAALCTTASASWGVAAAAITTMLLALVLMWRWVVALESAGTPPR